MVALWIGRGAPNDGLPLPAPWGSACWVLCLGLAGAELHQSFPAQEARAIRGGGQGLPNLQTFLAITDTPIPGLKAGPQSQGKFTMSNALDREALESLVKSVTMKKK